MSKCNEKGYIMESANALKQDERAKQLTNWLTACGVSIQSIDPMPGDASFRRYFRIHTLQQSYVAMDAPPPENCRPFVAVAKSLKQLGLHVPDIIHADVESGFLLLTDFGDATYLKTLNSDNADLLYKAALDALSTLQHCREVPGHVLPIFDREFMLQEWAWHKEWFLNKLLQVTLSKEAQQALDECYELLIESAVNQPQVFMYRDFQSANLMVLPHHQVGLLDFQDAFIGPVTYDLVSILRDCYIAWPEEQVLGWVHYYWQQLSEQKVIAVDEATFIRWFDFMGVQRHLKALLTFARKQVRDQQPQYLKHVPRTLNYLQVITKKYPELNVLHQYIVQTVQGDV